MVCYIFFPSKIIWLDKINLELLVSELFVGSGEQNTWFPVAFMIDKDGHIIHVGKNT